MNLPVNQFKRALGDGRTIFGAWLGSGAPSTAEALGCAGFDFLVVDMEHTPVDAPQLIDLLRAVAGTPAPAVVRMPWNDMVMVKRALDAGAQTVMLPFVQNAEEAKRAVAYTRYPPDGVRGVAGSHRASRYGTVPNYLQNAQFRDLRDRADRNAGRTRTAAADCRRARHRFHLHRAERPVRVDGPPGRHRQRRRAGKVEAGCEAVSAIRKAQRHHRHQSRAGRANSPTTATTGSPSAPTWPSWSDARRNGSRRRGACRSPPAPKA